MSGGTIALLRQADDAGDMKAAIEARGYECLIEPILNIEILPADYAAIKPATPLVFTSANAVKSCAMFYEGRSNPVFTVGQNTAEAAQMAGFGQIQSAGGNVETLGHMLLEKLKTGLTTPVYMRGEDVSQDLKGFLTQNGQKMDEITAYRAEPAHNLSIKLLHALDKQEIKAVAVFSARGGKTLSDLAEQYGRLARFKTVIALCISAPVLQSVSVLPFQSSLVAPTPDRHGMMKLLDQFFVTKE